MGMFEQSYTFFNKNEAMKGNKFQYLHPTGTITKSDLSKEYLPFREIYKPIIPAH